MKHIKILNNTSDYSFKKGWLLSLTILVLIGFVSCVEEDILNETNYESATISTTAINTINANSAKSGGIIRAPQSRQISRGVCWSTGQNPTILLPTKTSDGSGIGEFSSSIAGLQSGITYYVRAYYSDNLVTVYGNQLSFTTTNSTNISTTSPSSILSNSAISGGTIISDGGYTITSRGVCWGTVTNPTINNNKTIDGFGTGTFISSLSGLSVGTTYYVRAYATNILGTTYGDQKSFSTLTSSGIIGYYSFDGNANDVSGFARNGIVSGATLTTDAKNATSSAYLFSNSSNISIGDYFENTSQLSFSMWFNPTNTSTNKCLFSKLNSSIQVGGYTLMVVNGFLWFYLTNSSNQNLSCNTTNAIVQNQNWQHVALILDLTQTVITDRVKIYYNGVLQTLMFTSSVNINLIPNTTIPFRIGVVTENTGISTYFNGKLDALRIYSNIITQSEIQSLSNEFPKSVIDFDGNTYQPIIIGTQTWMVENLKSTSYNDGTVIPLVTDSAFWRLSSTPGYCWYNNSISNKNTYGALYNWFTVNTGKLAPNGWHIPTDTEWTVLTDYLGGLSVAGGSLKEAGTSHWFSPNTGANNSSGFTALPSGWRDNANGSNFIDLNYSTVWWTATDGSGRCRSVEYNKSIVIRDNYYTNYGFSVRCIKDN